MVLGARASDSPIALAVLPCGLSAMMTPFFGTLRSVSLAHAVTLLEGWRVLYLTFETAHPLSIDGKKGELPAGARPGLPDVLTKRRLAKAERFRHVKITAWKFLPF
jgi:hypothetical protein